MIMSDGTSILLKEYTLPSPLLLLSSPIIFPLPLIKINFNSSFTLLIFSSLGVVQTLQSIVMDLT